MTPPPTGVANYYEGPVEPMAPGAVEPFYAVETLGDDVGRIAVHVAARICALAGPGEVLVSRTMGDLVTGSGMAFESRGTRTLKGVPDEWELFAAGGTLTQS